MKYKRIAFFGLVPHGTLDKVENDEDDAESRRNRSE